MSEVARKTIAKELAKRPTWTNVPPAISGEVVDRTNVLPFGKYKMPDGSEQVSFAMPGMIQAGIDGAAHFLKPETAPDPRAMTRTPNPAHAGASFNAAGMTAGGGAAFGRVPRGAIGANAISRQYSDYIDTLPDDELVGLSRMTGGHEASRADMMGHLRGVGDKRLAEALDESGLGPGYSNPPPAPVDDVAQQYMGRINSLDFNDAAGGYKTQVNDILKELAGLDNKQLGAIVEDVMGFPEASQLYKTKAQRIRQIQMGLMQREGAAVHSRVVKSVSPWQ